MFVLPTLPRLDVPIIPDGWATDGYGQAVIEAGTPTRVLPSGAVILPEWAAAVASTLQSQIPYEQLVAVLRWLALQPDRDAIGFTGRVGGAQAVLAIVATRM